MVSFQAPFLELNQTTTTTKVCETETTSKKRKWHISDGEQGILPFKNCKNPKDANTTTVPPALNSSLIQFHLETPLPSEWQRCLDIQTGEIHFYNTKTHKRTMRDPRSSPEPSSPTRDCHHMSLDLELNLPCGSLNSNSSSSLSEKSASSPKTTTIKKKTNSNSPPPLCTDLFMGLGIVSEKNNNDDEPEKAVEMVAAVCMKCHMLVMLCKSSPTCPNCKFMHPPYQTSTDLFKSRLRLSC